MRLIHSGTVIGMNLDSNIETSRLFGDNANEFCPERWPDGKQGKDPEFGESQFCLWWSNWHVYQLKHRAP